MTQLQPREVNDGRLGQIRFALQSLLFLAVIGSMYFARDFLLPVVLAFFIALTLRPAVRYLQRWLVPPWVAATIFVLLIVTAAVLFGYILQAPIASWIEQAPQLQQKFTSKFSNLEQIFTRFSNFTDQIQNAAAPDQGVKVQEVEVRQHAFPGFVVSLTGYPIQFGVTLAATLVIAVFVLASGDLFYEKLVRTLPTLSARKKALQIVYDIESEVSTYVLTLTLVNAALGIVIALTFQALGMPSPYLWGLLIFVVNFVPYIGTISGVILASFMAIVTFESLGYALLVPLSYTIWSLLESEIIRPLILGRRFQMNAVAILLSIAFWSWLWGVPGAAIAVPALITLKIFCEHVDGLTGLGEFLSSRRPEPTEENVAEIREGP